MRSASADISEKIVGGIDRRRVAIRLRGEALVGAGMARLYDAVGAPEPVRRLLHREAPSVGDDRAVSQPTVEDPPRRGRRGLGTLLWSGVALILAGLVMLGYVGWQFYGTNVVSARKQKQIVERTQQMWAAEPEVSVRARPERHRSAAALVRIPAFGSDYVLPVQQGISDGVLAEGFGHFDGTAGPGEIGNYALAGHRVTHGEPLRNMPSLRPGDTVLVETRTRRFTYRLDTDPNLLTVVVQRRLGHRPAAREPGPRRPAAGSAARPAADHADHLLGAVPHRQPDGRLRPPGAQRCSLSPRRAGLG